MGAVVCELMKLLSNTQSTKADFEPADQALEFRDKIRCAFNARAKGFMKYVAGYAPIDQLMARKCLDI